MERHLRSVLIVLGLLLLQTTFIPFLSIGGFVPDLLFIWVISSALRHGQIEATIAGFFVGLLQDLVATQLFGLAALSNTIAAFLAGYFYNENKIDQILGTYQFILIVGLCSLMHNVIYYTIFLQGSGLPLFFTVIEFSFATTTYTTALSALPMFAFSRKVAV